MTNSKGTTFRLPLAGSEAGLNGAAGGEVLLGLRPENICPNPVNLNGASVAHIECVVDVVEPTGPDTLVYVELNGREVVCRVAPDAEARPGKPIKLYIDLSKAHFFDPADGVRLA